MKKILSIVALMFMSQMSFASVVVRDRANVMSQTQRQALIDEGSRWPFELHVLTGTFSSFPDMDAAVHKCITGPNVVCIGIDPSRHKTVVHFGTATGIPNSAFYSITTAGNSYFKQGDWQGGIEAIATAARNAVNATPVPIQNTPTTTTTIQQPVQVHIENPNTSAGWWVFAIIMGAIGLFSIWVVLRARKTVKKINDDMNDFRDEAFEMSSRNMEERDFHEKLKAKIKPEKQTMTATPTVKPTVKTVTQPATQTHTTTSKTTPATTTVVNNVSTGSNGPSTGDVLLAYELGRLSTPTPAPVVVTPTVTREIVRETVRSSDDGGSSSSWSKSDDDAGSSRSSWDDDDKGSSSSSWDSSSDSSSSSWDSGGSDSGGGSDGGGGGSDW